MMLNSSARFRLLPLLLGLLFCHTLWGQNAQLQYIERYCPLAQDQMRRYGVPASITLAQGLLESAAGQSYLARKANNHFGIKATGEWSGPYVLRDDDARGEHFRAYASVEESYEDHSLFLKRPRYSKLFSLRTTDYKGWARGLREAGYATNPQYAQRLIELIEAYGLHQYDHPASKRTQALLAAQQSATRGGLTQQSTVGMRYGNYFVSARRGDTYKALAKRYGLRTRTLRHINDAPRRMEPEVGCPVWFEKKLRRASRSMPSSHTAQSGESAYSIAQQYNLRLKPLLRRNPFLKEHPLRVGDIVRLR